MGRVITAGDELKTARICNKWDVVMPDFLADWDAWADWECARFTHMAEHLKQGDVLFDIGTEFGAMSVVYASFVGAANMCLFESASKVWPNIYQTWKANGLDDPLACFVGLVGDETPERIALKEGWPSEINGPLLTERQYVYLHDSDAPRIRLDDWVESSPDAITIDVEGAEFSVLTGAFTMLAIHRPLVWVSIHPDLMLRDYDHTPPQVFTLFEDLDYEGKHLATDHEEHHFFWPKERRT